MGCVDECLPFVYLMSAKGEVKNDIAKTLVQWDKEASWITSHGNESVLWRINSSLWKSFQSGLTHSSVLVGTYYRAWDNMCWNAKFCPEQHIRLTLDVDFHSSESGILCNVVEMINRLCWSVPSIYNSIRDKFSSLFGNELLAGSLKSSNCPKAFWPRFTELAFSDIILGYLDPRGFWLPRTSKSISINSYATHSPQSKH